MFEKYCIFLNLPQVLNQGGSCFFIAAQIIYPSYPMLFKWAGNLGNSKEIEPSPLYSHKIVYFSGAQFKDIHFLSRWIVMLILCVLSS